MMFWVGALLFAALLSGISNVLVRKASKNADPLSLAVYFNVFTVLAFLPLLLLEKAVLPVEQWPFILASAGIWFIINCVTFHAFKHTDITLMRPIMKTNVLFVALLSVVFLSEQLSTLTLLGTLIIFVGMIALSWNRKQWDKMTWKGVGLTLIGAVGVALTAVLDKFNIMSNVSPALYGMLLYLIPGIGFGIMAMGRKKELMKTTRAHWRILAVIGAVGAVYYWIVLNIYKTIELNIAYPALQVSVIFSMIIAYLWLKEKTDFRNRMIGAAAIIVGAVLVTLGA